MPVPQPPDDAYRRAEMTMGYDLAAAGLLSGAARHMRLDTWQFEPAPDPAARLAAYDAACSWLDGHLELPDDRSWLYFYGPYGTGKTHLSVALLYELVCATFRSGRLLNWTTTVETKMEAISTGDHTADRLLAAARDADYLVVDDLDKADGSRFTMRILYSLIDTRIMAGRATILTANRPIHDLPTHWVATARPEERPHVADRAAAIAERLAYAVAAEVHVGGPSFRLR